MFACFDACRLSEMRTSVCATLTAVLQFSDSKKKFIFFAADSDHSKKMWKIILILLTSFTKISVVSYVVDGTIKLYAIIINCY